MTDKELLELAAKAEGHSVYFDENSGNTLLDDEFTGILWNPLHNDGDALRLAVQLRIDLSFGVSSIHALAVSTECGGYSSLADDPAAATRRAIVICAAEIGKEMK